MFDRIRDWWEGKTMRERRLVALLGATAVLVLLAWIGFQIADGLSELEAQNAARRQALDTLAEHREEIQQSRLAGGDPLKQIDDEAEPLPTYLESIEGKVGVKITNVTPEKVTPKGKFVEKSVQVTLYNVTLEQLARFLERMESDSPIVVTQRLYVKRSTANKEQLDRVEITVATYERARKEGTKVAREGAAEGEEKQAAEEETTP